MPIRSTFGTPSSSDEAEEILGLAGVAEQMVHDHEVEAALRRVQAQLKRDRLLVEAGGRWRPGIPDPVEFIPGDVLALRSLAITTTLNQATSLLELSSIPSLADVDRTGMRRIAQVLASQVSWIASGAPYWLGVRDTIGILASRPPDPDLLATLRLPFPLVSVYFGADLAFDPRFLAWSDSMNLPERLDAAMFSEWLAQNPDQAEGDLERQIRDRGGYLTGVTMLAGPGQIGLADCVLWHVATEAIPTQADPAGLDRGRGFLLGRLSCATLASLAANLAAAVAWGGWKPPDPLPLLPEDPSSRAWRKALKTGRARRAERRGSFGAVHIFDVDRKVASAPSSEPSPEAPTRSSPVTHTRRGHWRRVRVGPREAWHHEGRWIAPTVVNPGGSVRRSVTVYRLPVPDAARAALGVGEDDPTGLPEPAT